MDNKKIRVLPCEELAAYFFNNQEEEQGGGSKEPGSQIGEEIKHGGSLLKKCRKVIILDTRTLTQYSAGHISSAIHIWIPNTLLKRKNFTFANIEATLGCHEARQRLRLRHASDVILCDVDGTSIKKADSCLVSLMAKFQEESLVNSVSFLEGGYQNFCQLYPELCTKRKEKSHSSSSSPFCLSLPSRKCVLTEPENNHANGRKQCEVNTTLSDDRGEPARILDFLYVGDQQMAAHETTLEKYGINWVLNTATECPNFFGSNPKYTYMRLDLTDSASQTLSMSTLERAFTFIDDARKNHQKVLVHCQAGQSRSATIVISYIIRTFRWSLKDAYQYTQSKRKSVSPNLGFMAQLSQFEKTVLGVSSPMQQVFSECEKVLTTPQFLDCAA